WAVAKRPVMVILAADRNRQRASKILSGVKAVECMAKVIFRLPAQLGARARVDVDAVDLRKQRPSPRRVDRLTMRKPPANHLGGAVAQRRQIGWRKWCCRRD